MASCEFSEFSFGYALTHSLMSVLGTALGKAPVFPSLLQEGSTGGGFDLKLPLVPFPIFLQFKIPFVLKRSSSLKPAAYNVPYYRIPFRTKEPNQHQLLLDLEAKEPLVFYAAPLFHGVNDLDHHFTNQVVHKDTTFIKPSKIGPLDAKRHHLSYRPLESIYWLRSEPEPVKGPLEFESFVETIKHHRESMRKKFQLAGRQIASEEANDRRQTLLLHLRDEILSLERKFEGLPRRATAGKPSTPIGTTEIYAIDNTDPPDMARRVAYLAQVRLGLTLALGEASDTNQP